MALLRRVERQGPTFLFATLFGSVTYLVLRYELAPQSRGNLSAPFLWTDRQRDVLQTVTIAFVAVSLVAHCVVRKTSKFRIGKFLTSIELATLVTLTLTSGLAYFYGAHGSRHAYSHLHDSYHYLLGPKYFAELGYNRLYECTVQASSQREIPDSTRVRDLSSDTMITAGEVRRAVPCASLFSADRFAEFRHDLRVFETASRGSTRSPLRDRGYNGSPLQTFMASAIANAVPLSYRVLSLVTLFDVIGICAMLAIVCRAFGARLGMLCAILFFSQYVDRHLIIGGSFLRYQWVSALGIGIASFKLGRYALAGSMLTTSAFLNVFPILFAVPIWGKIGARMVRKRPLTADHRSFLLGSLVAGLLCVLLGLAHGHGVRNYAEFSEAMRVHDAAGRAPGFGVGIKYDFLRSDYTGSLANRGDDLAHVWPVVVVSALLLIAWMIVLLPRLDEVESSVLFGFTALFCVFGPTGYYYCFAALLAVIWHRRLQDSGELTMLALLFAVSMLPLVTLLAGAHRFFVFNRMVSATWSVYLVLALGYFSWRLRSGFASRSSEQLAALRRAVAQSPGSPRAGDGTPSPPTGPKM